MAAPTTAEPKVRRFSLAREEVRRAWRELRGDAMSPWRGALAVALGLFIGSQPIFGCHTPLVLIICLWFRLDAAVAWVASNISNPFFAPFLLTAEVQVGATLLTGAPLRIDLYDGGLADYAGYAFAGAPIVGAALAVLGAAATFGGIRLKRVFWPSAPAPPPYELPAHAPPWIRAAERVANRYASWDDRHISSGAERTRFHYVRIKLVGDPIARLIADVIGTEPGILGEVLDVGTGRGQLPIMLLELGRATKALGIDWDATKIAAAKEAAGPQPDGNSLDASFVVGDARDASLPDADTVLLIDVLHYFTEEEQDAILRRAAGAVRPDGRLLVREADTERGWRSAMTWMEERFFTLVRFNRGERVHFRSAREIVATLEREGLACRIRPAWGKTPFSNVLIIGSRAPRPEGSTE